MCSSDLERQRAYWRRNLTLTLTLLSVWFGVTFFGGYFARELNTLSFMGFPLGFYLFAQGSLLIYLAKLGLASGVKVQVIQGQGKAELVVKGDNTVPVGCIRVAAAHASTSKLGDMFGQISVERL